MNSFWDERYSVKEFVYGKKPNEFFKQELLKINPGKLLLPAEGEGRNAVFAAIAGWKVTAFDLSMVGKKKAERLAKSNLVKIEYKTLSLESCIFDKESFDAIALIFAHVHKDQRRKIHQRILNFLKPGGTLILEAFSEKQINMESGGPKDINMLYNPEELKVDFLGMQSFHCWEESVNLSEGKFHKGFAHLVRMVGTK
jgi:SAM-dependent methyltransferase